MAAELIEVGVDVHNVYRKLYEEVPPAKLNLLARGLTKIKRYDDGKLTLTSLNKEDYKVAGAKESHSEGVVDYLRSLEGTTVAALVREREHNHQQGRKKVSLRSSSNDLDVSVIARAQGGGGHRQAAGFSTDLSCDMLIEFLREQIAAQLSQS
jgi:phosphoesterase RecJ-like protein